LTPDASRELVIGLKVEARRLGFSLVGVTGSRASGHMELYRGWIGQDRHGEMAYLAREDSVARRADLTATMDSVRSVIVVAHDYYVEDAPDITADASRGVIARYARGDDYHDVVREKLLDLLSWIRDEVGGDVLGRAYVDTGPILERELAQRAGLGWFGRNTVLINPAKGSYFFVGVLLLDIDLPHDDPFEEDRCGTCRACLDACPTAALLGRDAQGAPVIDARRCISYLTIELRGPIPIELRPGMGNRIFGCDICQEVCPWNEKFAEACDEPAYRAREGLDGPRLMELADQLLSVDDRQFRELFAKSPMRRAKRTGLLRNVCVALGNWGARESLPTLERAIRDPAPLVRGHAAWALGEVGSPDAVSVLVERVSDEDDDWVQREIELALS